MSQPESDAIANQIRSARVVASAELRERVRAIAAATPADSAPAAGAALASASPSCWCP